MNKKNILAIDVGTGMVKVFAGKLQADGSVAIVGSGTAPTAGYARGVITDINALAYSIRQAVDCVIMAADTQAAGGVYLGLSGSTLVTQNSIGSVAPSTPGTVTRLDVERACKAAMFSVAQDDADILHVFPAKESAVLPGAALEVEAHIISAPKAIIQELREALAGKGIQLNGIVAGSVIAAETMKNELPARPGNFIFIDMGAGTSELVIYVGGNLCYSASLPLGGDYITSDLMQGIGVSQAHAEEIKRYYSRLSPDLRNQGIVLDCNDYGTTDKHVHFDFLYDIIESRVDEIVTLMYDYLKPLMDKYLPGSEQTFERIYLTGGSGATPSMAACVAKVFQLDTEVVKPDRLAAEYVHPSNTVCYGIISHGTRIVANEPEAGQSAWGVFIDKAKKLLKI